jgi:hypothetical protein
MSRFGFAPKSAEILDIQEKQQLLFTTGFSSDMDKWK